MGTQIQVKSPKLMAAILMLGAFIGLFGETALNMALTDIMGQFSITAATAQWLTTGYLLTLAILVPISALLMKWFSTRQLIIGGLVISLAGAAGTAISITLFTAGQANFAASTPDAAQGEILATVIKYAFYFITGISVLAVICSIFMKKPSAVKEKSTSAVIATEPVRN